MLLHYTRLFFLKHLLSPKTFAAQKNWQN